MRTPRSGQGGVQAVCERGWPLRECGAWRPGRGEEAEGVWAYVRGCAGPGGERKGEGEAAWVWGLLVLDQSLPPARLPFHPLPLPSAQSGCFRAESRKLQAIVSAPGPWVRGRGIRRGEQLGIRGKSGVTGPLWSSYPLSTATGAKGSRKMRASWTSAAC